MTPAYLHHMVRTLATHLLLCGWAVAGHPCHASNNIPRRWHAEDDEECQGEEAKSSIIVRDGHGAWWERAFSKTVGLCGRVR